MSGFRGKKVDPGKTSNGRPIGTGNPARTSAAVVAPPALADGQARCPACRNGAHLFANGTLRRHRDLFGNTCWNRRAPGSEVHLTEVPPVVINAHATAEKGKCRECGKWLPGERSLCGRCSVLRSA